MDIKTFIYTKPDGSISQRKVLVMHKASDYDKCIDLSVITDKSTITNLTTEITQLRNSYSDNLNKILNDYGLVDNIRNFKIDRMSNVQSEKI